MSNSRSLDVSVIIVSYNTRALTLACLESVYRETREVAFEVIVLDNASGDGSAEAIAAVFPRAALIASETNLGFAAGNNLAAQRATGRYVLLLNPDTVVLNGAIDRLVAFAEGHPDAAILGGRTVFPDGSLNPSSVWRKPSVWNAFCRSVGLSAVFKNSPIWSADVYGGWRRDTVREVDIVSGCFLLIRSELWRALEGFDTRYFMYGEDWDLCIRARALGHGIRFTPNAEIVHYGGASESVRADKVVRLFTTKVQLFEQHWRGPARIILKSLLVVYALRSLVQNAALSAFNPAHRDGALAWRGVLARRSEWFRYGI